MPANPSWTDVLQAIAVSAQLIVLVAAAGVAWVQVREARRLREAQARPFVVVDFDVKDDAIGLVVSNLGNVLATDVRFEIAPPLDSTLRDYQARDLQLFRQGIPTFAPGKVIRTLFDWFPDREQAGLPDAYKVTIRYGDETRRRQFEEVVDLDIGLYRNLLTMVRHDAHHVNATLGKILDEMKRWRGVGKKGLLVMSPRQRRSESKRQFRSIERRGRQWHHRAPRRVTRFVRLRRFRGR